MFSKVLTASIVFSLSFIGLVFVVLPARAEFIQTYSPLDSYDGELTASGFPMQRFTPSTTAYLNYILAEWTGTAADAAGICGSNMAGCLLRDRTAGVSYFVPLAYSVSSTATGAFFKPTTTVQLIADHQYEFFFNNYNFGRKSPSSTYRQNDNWDEAGSRSTVPNGTFTSRDYDIGMKVYTSVLPQNTTAIEWYTTPEETCDFDEWRVNMNIPIDTYNNTASSTWATWIIYGDNIANLNRHTESLPGFVTPITPSGAPIPKNEALFPGLIYFAYAFICDAGEWSACDPEIYGYDIGSPVKALSSLWQFSVTPSDSPDCANQTVQYPGSFPITVTSTNPSENFTCDEADSFFETSLCNLFQTLFRPSSDALDRFGDLGEALQNKPPFGYVTAYGNLLDDVTITSSTATSSYAFTSLSGFAFFGIIRKFLIAILWFTVAAFLFNRFRNLDV